MSVQVPAASRAHGVVPNMPGATALPQRTLGDVIEFAGVGAFADVWWLTRLHLDRPRNDIRCLTPATRCGKRLLDILVAIAALILAAPLMLVVALAVRLTSRGPIIFRQTRVGLNLRKYGSDRRLIARDAQTLIENRRRAGTDRRGNFTYGRHFTMYKFRTMQIDAEKDGARFAQKGDARITSIGRFLRKTRLDELPQLWNVLRGEMSLVGPRPERPEFMQDLSHQIPGYLDRLGLQPGLTGVAQILNGYDNELQSFKRKAAFDLHYLQNCSIWNDVKILVRTIGVILTGSGAL